jgi:hypothetical protein
MKKLTKNQRHNIYKDALNSLTQKHSPFDKLRTIWYYDCICHSIMRVKYNYMSEFDTFELLNVFHEFSLFQPEFNDSYWFDNKDERILCLLFCIEMTK